MGIINRLFGAKAETRAADPSWGMAFGPAVRTASGTMVSPYIAENLATVTACVNATASALATLPAYVYQQVDAGRIEAPAHPVSRLIRRPNAAQTWPDLTEWIVAQVLLRGNALCVMQHDGAGRITDLVPVPWQNASVQLLPSGRLAYDVAAYRSPWPWTGMPRRYFADEVLHLKDRSDDGLIGRSRISRAPDVIGNAASLQDFAGYAWQNQAAPSGAIEFSQSLSAANFERVRDQVQQKYAGVGNAGKVLILDNGMTWKSISVSPEDAEVLASRRFSVEELCRLFNVPPPIVQDYSHNTFTNSAQADLWFASRTLMPWARKIEAEFKRSVFGINSNYELEIDLSGLMRGDFETRWNAYATAVQNQILDVDEIREQEGYGPRRQQAAV